MAWIRHSEIETKTFIALQCPLHYLYVTVYSLYWAGNHDCHVRLVEYNYTGTLILKTLDFFFTKSKNETKKRKKTEKKTELK